MTRAVLVRIEGRVQGVGYRAWTETEARRRGLAGWVRNRRDGSVDALIAGAAAEVEAMLDAFRAGPSGSRVDSVSTEEAESPQQNGFSVLPTD